MAGIPMEIVPESQSMNIHVIRSQISDIAEICRNCKYDESDIEPSDTDKIVYELASQIQLKKNVDHILSECSEFEALGDEDLDECVAHLETNIRMMEEEKTKLSNEVGDLEQTFYDDLTCLETELERLTYSVDHIASKALECTVVGHNNSFEDNSLRAPLYDTKFEMLGLNDQLEKNTMILQSLKELDTLYRRFEAVESIEDTLSGVEVLCYENNFIQFAVRTYIPRIGGSVFKPTFDYYTYDSTVMYHELSIKLVSGTLEPESLEVIPNDFYFDEILKDTKSVSHTNTLEWLVRKLQDRILICTLSNSSRHSFEYNDREETVISHMVGDIDAHIKVPAGWPIIDSTLKLISLRSPDQKRISLTFICKVQELANSLDTLVRQNLQSFVDAIEEILVQQMRLELHQ